VSADDPVCVEHEEFELFIGLDEDLVVVLEVHASMFLVPVINDKAFPPTPIGV